MHKILQASFPNPGDDLKIKEIFEDDLRNGTDSLGINIHRVGSEIRFEVPIVVFAADIRKLEYMSLNHLTSVFEGLCQL